MGGCCNAEKSEPTFMFDDDDEGSDNLENLDTNAFKKITKAQTFSRKKIKKKEEMIFKLYILHILALYILLQIQLLKMEKYYI